MKPELFTKDTTAIVYGYHVNAIQRMLDFDYACGRKAPSVAAIVNPEIGRASCRVRVCLWVYIWVVGV